MDFHHSGFVFDWGYNRMCDVTMVVQYLFGGVVRNVNTRMLGRDLSLVNADNRVEAKSSYCLQIILHWWRIQR